MRIAICGAGSTGKTTLASALLSDPQIKQLKLKSIDVNARKLITAMGHKNIDLMTPSELQVFQRKYVLVKIDLEKNETNYITQRSFVDSAAYWVIRDALCESPLVKEEFVNMCKPLAQQYNAHIFIPFGQIPLEHDGYRSSNLEQFYAVSEQIESYLNLWNINYLRISTGELDARIKQAKEYIFACNGGSKYE